MVHVPSAHASEEPGGTEARQPGADSLARRLRELQRAHLELDRRLAAHLKLGANDYQAMAYLIEIDDPLGPVELSAELGISTGSGTELADRLERAGHVRRRRHPVDRRRVVLEPSLKSSESMLVTLAPLFESLAALDDEFTEEQREAVNRYLREAAARLRHYTEVRLSGER